MKKVLILLTLVLAPMSFAQANNDSDLNLTKEQKRKILKKFDKDGDKKLNDQERAAAKRALQKRSNENWCGTINDGMPSSEPILEYAH